MNTIRVIPSLLLHDKGLVKGINFKNYKYIGDPVNAVNIFNEKEVDELVFLDIDATREKRPPDFSLIERIASQAFMPLGYGGGINNVRDIERILRSGVEKVIINSAIYYNKKLIRDATNICGSQSIVASIDVRKDLLKGYRVYINNGTKNTGIDPIEYSKMVEDCGAGEILLTSIDREGTGNGFELELIKKVSEVVSIPVIAAGGALKIEDFRDAILAGASAISAGSMFVFHGKHRAVLIKYPDYNELEKIFFKISEIII